jgi:hypothetical protein
VREFRAPGGLELAEEPGLKPEGAHRDRRTAADYLSRPATAEEVARTMPRLVEMWPAHNSHTQRNGVRHVIVFEPTNTEASSPHDTEGHPSK